MPPELLEVISFISLTLVSQFIADQGYGKIRRLIFRKKKFIDILEDILYNSITEHEKRFPVEENEPKYPFYHSRTLFTEFNKLVLSKSKPSNEIILDKLNENQDILIPSDEELNNFYEIFVRKIRESENLEKLFINENYKERIFKSHDLLTNIYKEVSLIKEKLSIILREEWFDKQCQDSIYDLGSRYTPELNFELEISEIFEGLGRTEKFKKTLTKLFDQLFIEGRKNIKNNPEIKDNINIIKTYFDELYELFQSIDFLETNILPTKKLEELLTKIEKPLEEIRDYYYTEKREFRKKEENQYKQKFAYEIRNVINLKDELDKVRYFIDSTTCKLANNPFLLLSGEAGIGKSHLIGDIVTKRIKENYESVFILGQHLVTKEDPWTQIFKRLQINVNCEEFLGELNQRGEKQSKRVIIFIDAINEGKGKYFWINFIRSFVNDIKRFEWLGLVMTIRTSYKNLIFPEKEKSHINIEEYTHYGFRSVEYEVSKLFFENYKIELPKIPMLHNEFQNPLFLKLFCEGINKAGFTCIPDGLQGITSIIDFFIKSVNDVLSKPNRLNYSNSLNLVWKSIDALIQHKVDKQLWFVPYEEAYKIVDSTISHFIDCRGFIDELIIEGVLSKNLFWIENDEYEEGVYLAFERFEDHLTSKYLLEHFPDLDVEFKEGGRLHNYVIDEDALNLNMGLIDAFAIQIPEIKGKELFEFVPTFKDNHPIIESFIESLLWRKVETINEESKNYVNEYVFLYQDTHDLFWDTIISVTATPGHYFNALLLHQHLSKLTLAERDSNWTQFLKYRYSNESSVKRLIDWAWSDTDKSHISEESIKLSGITLAWFHTSTDRSLRDCSTKALVCVLQNRLNVLIEIMELFEEVNDPYVYERLFAVAYGCTLRTNQKEILTKLSEYIFKTVFDNPDGVFPHILLRDYARGVIEYTHHLGYELSFEMPKVRPPYKSTWPEEIPSLEVLKEKYNNNNYWQLWESVMGFGDFARYTIGTNFKLSEWSGCKKGGIPVDREKVLLDFKSKLNPDQLKLFHELDPIITEDPEDDQDTIGPFHYKIAVGRKSEELLNQTRVKFITSLNPNILAFYEKEIEPYLDHNHKIFNSGDNFDLRIAQRLIFSKVIELGWNPDLHLEFDKIIGHGRGRNSHPNERIGKKYQWIAYYEYLALLSDNFIKNGKWGNENAIAYQGPWDPYVRDIDPTLLNKKTGEVDEDTPEYFWWFQKEIFNWDCSNENWVNDSDSLPSIDKSIQVKDQNGGEWLVLEGYPGWAEPKMLGEKKWDYPCKHLWFHLRSYLVKESEVNKLKKWASKQNFMGDWMPESKEQYSVFSREYFWSPAYKYFEEEYNDNLDNFEVRDRETKQCIANVVVTADKFQWEAEFDKSKMGSISFLRPCKKIHEGMNLKYGMKEGEFVNESDEVMCIAAGVFYNSKSFLLIKKIPFLKYLKDNNLRLLWTVLGGKEIIGSGKYLGRLEINGAYYFDGDNKLHGTIHTNHTKN